MREIWDRIEHWLKLNAPQGLAALQAGATVDQIREVEEFLAAEFPEDVKASFRIHNGQSNYTFGFMLGRELLSLERIKSEWQVWKELLDDGTFNGSTSEPQAGIKAEWWNPHWIPLTYDGSGNHHCLDLSPAAGGKLGQIITMWHDDTPRELVADNFHQWLEAYAKGLDTGKYIYSDEYAGIVDIDDI